MAINKNHEFEDINGIKCAIVEKNVPAQRVDFLKKLLNINGYTVVITEAPPPKQPAKLADDTIQIPEPEKLYTVGVTNLMFNAINAVYGRLLKTEQGNFVTPAYWQQKDAVSDDSIPYFENK